MANKKYPSVVTAIATAELGYLEKKSNKDLDDKTANAGSANFTKYWRDLYPSFQGSAWCNCFVNWIFVKAFGEEEAKKLLCTDGAWSFYTPTSSNYFKRKNQWQTNPKAGDIIYFKNSTRIHHVGYVYKVSDGYVYTIEGNTGGGNEVIPNGGGVFAKQYLLTNTAIAGYGRPNYDTDVENEAAVLDIPISMDRAGLKIVGAEHLNIRKTPLNGDVVGSYALGEYVMATAKSRASDGNYWFKTDKGYISGKYVEGWIKEANEKWWYVLQGYGYPSNTLYQVDDEWYIFDKDGWMITADRINTDGSVQY